jgi:dipeptidyl aminopeptidase/acylaminoacyl peptidase
MPRPVSPLESGLTGHEGYVNIAAFSPDSKRIITASRGSTARLWDAGTGTAIVLKGRGDDFDFANTAAFSPDGKRIIIASRDHWAQLWDAESGKRIAKPFDGENAAFSPDGKRIVTASSDKARLWDAESGAAIGEPLKGHRGDVQSAQFSPDGKRILTVGDSAAQLWDAESGKRIAEPLGQENTVSAAFGAAFSPDGKRILTVGGSAARLWRMSGNVQELVSHAKAGIPRCLTSTERNAFFMPPEPPPWCIELDKWPYNTPVWKQWLADTRAGKNPPLPATPQ